MKTKLLLAMVVLLLTVAVMCARTLVTTAGPSQQDRSATRNLAHSPDPGLIDKLDQVIQLRFLTMPTLGIRRIGPSPNPHFEHFEAQTEDERVAVAQLEQGDLKVGVFLMGRRAYETPAGKDGTRAKPLLVQYKLNEPVPVTANVKKSELTRPKKLRNHVDTAFERFKTGSSYNFYMGEWSYVATPVRAQAACLKCHQDMFVTSKVGEKKYQYRRRRVGDTIGVLFYAFRKKR